MRVLFGRDDQFSNLVQNFLFREGQVNFFSKRGMSVHGTVVYTIENGKLRKRVYICVADESDQGLLETLAATKFTLQQLKEDAPNVKFLYFKSDNASSYVGKLKIATL